MTAKAARQNSKELAINSLPRALFHLEEHCEALSEQTKLLDLALFGLLELSRDSVVTEDHIDTVFELATTVSMEVKKAQAMVSALRAEQKEDAEKLGREYRVELLAEGGR